MKKNKEKLLEKQNDRYINFKELVRTYVELENRFKSIGRKGTQKIILAK